MPPEPLPIDRKEFLKDRKPSSSEPGEIVPARWRDSPTTPSSHYNNRGSPSCRWGGGPSDFRRPFTGHGRPVESGPAVSVDFVNSTDRKGGECRETSASPIGNSHPQSDFVNHWDQLQLNDQHAKSSVDGVGTTCSQKLEKTVSLGSSLDWKPLKWIRSGSLSSRGSSFSHLSSCKIIGVDSLDTKMEAQSGSATPVQSPSGDAATCMTPRTLEEVNSRKKPRLGWGEGLAKYEKKKVDPDDIVDKENGSRNGMVVGGSSSESLLPSPYLPCKSPCLTGNSESVSPTNSCSFASLSSGLEEKASITANIVDNDTCDPSVALSQNHTHGLKFNLENFNLAEDFNLSSSLDELLQTDDTTAPGSGFAMHKLQVWKADISRTIEIAESEIDSLEQELKSLISNEELCSFPSASGSCLQRCNNNNTVDLSNISSVAIPVEKADINLEEQRDSAVCLGKRSEKAECSKDYVCKDGMQVSAGGSCIVSVGSAVYHGRENKLYDSIMVANKVTASRTSDELSKLLPATSLCTNIVRTTNDSLIKKRIDKRKRFLKFKERVITLKFRGFQYFWKENLHLLSVRSSAKLQKKFESSLRFGYIDSQKHRASNHSRSSTSAGCLSLVPTKEVVEYVKELLLDSRVKIYRNVQKMPTFILDKRERISCRFISDNGLVENPIDVEKERSVVNTWIEEDKQMFLDKYALFGKNFRKIASFFKNKTVADCVEFYYKNHKSESFQNAKKNSKFAKEKSSNLNTNSTYLVTSGKRPNRESGTTSLDMLGAASEMVANVDEQSNDFAIYCNEQETAAADVLAGICGSISSEALGSCITTSVDHQKLGRCSLNDVDEETCSDDSCGEEMNSSIWTDEERSTFIKAVKSYGKDFSMISRCLGTRSSDQCKVFYSKVKKCFGLDVMNLGAGSEGTMGANQGGDDQDDTCMVDSGSGISHDKSSMECKMDVEDLHSSDFREDNAESDRNLETDCRKPELVVEDKVGGNLEGAADSEAANLEESPQNTCSDSASGAKVEEHVTAVKSAKVCSEGFRESEHELSGTVKGSSYSPPEDLNSVSHYSRGSRSDLTADHGNNLDLNAASENVTCQDVGNGFVMPNLFPQDPNLQRKIVSSQDDVSSRLTFRKGGQRSSSIDGFKLNLHKRSLSSNEPQINLKLDESLLLPRDVCLQMGTDLTSVSQQQRRSSSLEKPSNKSGDVKLFGQIITNHSLPKSNSSAQENEKPDAGKSMNLKFDQTKTKDYAFGVENDLHLKRNFGFWDGNRIQTGFSSLPGSAVLLAKYPAAFSNISTLPKLDQHQHSSLESCNEQCNNLNVSSGYQTRKLTNLNQGPGYHAYAQPFTVDKLLPEMPRRKEFDALSAGVGGMNVVNGACNGVSDPVAAIRMHYAKTEQYKNGGAESWRSNVSDIGSR